MPIEVDASDVHSIEVDASAVSDFAESKGTEHASSGPAKYKGLADYAPSWAKGTAETVDTASNVLQKDLGNLVGMIPGKIGAMGKRFAADIPEAPKTAGGTVGKGLGTFMEYEMAGRIPGVSKLKAGPKASFGKQLAMGSARAGAEAGIVGTAQTGSVKEGAKQGAFAAVAAPAVTTLAKAISPLAQKSANKLYQRFLSPGGGSAYNKTVAKDAAEALIKQGQIALSEGSFVHKTEQRVMDANIAIENAENNLLTNMTATPSGQKGMLYVQGAINQLKSSQADHYIGGDVISGYESIVNAKGDLIKQLEKQKTKDGYMSASEAIKLRRAWDKLVKWERNPNNSMAPGIKDAYENTANALRGEIAKQVPGMEEANAQYHFWAGVNKVMKDSEGRHVGHRPLGLIGGVLAGGAAVAGFEHGGTGQAAEYLVAVGALSKMVDSGLNLTGSAVALSRLGDLIRTRRFGQVVNRLAAMSSPVVRSSSSQAPSATLDDQ